MGVIVLVVTRKHQLTGAQIAVIATALFIVRAGEVWLGRYVLAHTGGPLQIPAYVLVMQGWPEITISAMLGWALNSDHALIMATGLLAGTRWCWA